MKICHYFTPSVARQGVTWKRINSIASYLSKACETTVVTNVGYDAEENFERISTLRIVSLPASTSGFSKCWRGQLQELRPDIVHLHGLWCRNAVTAVFDAKRLRIPYIISTYGLAMPGASQLSELKEKLSLNVVWAYFMRHAAQVFTTYDEERDRLTGLGVSPGRIITVHGYLDPGPIAVKSGYQRTHQIAALVDFGHREDIDLLIQSLRVLENEVKGYRLVFLGNDTPEVAARLTERLHLAGISKSVTCQSVTDPASNAQDTLRASEMCVVLSPGDEMHSLIALALSCGLPFVAVRQTLHGDIEARHCGVVCDRRPTQLYSALLRMLRLSDNDMELMGRNARKLVEEKFSSQSTADMFHKVYQDQLPVFGAPAV